MKPHPNHSDFDFRGAYLNKEAWRKLLATRFWTHVGTFTFKDPQSDPIRVISSFDDFVEWWHLRAAARAGLADLSIDERRYYEAYRNPHELFVGPYPSAVRRGKKKNKFKCAVAIEHHRSGLLHLHALIVKSPKLPTLEPCLGVGLWRRELRHGIARIEVPRSQEDVIAYVTKHVPEDAEVWLSRGF